MSTTWRSCKTYRVNTTPRFVTHIITDSVFAGTAVGVATGTLSTAALTTYQDIAVVYASTGGNGIPVNESLVRVFQNTGIGFGYLVTPVPVTGGRLRHRPDQSDGDTVAALSGGGGAGTASS